MGLSPPGESPELQHPVCPWRNPKACEECRKRKIKCNGANPCQTCSLRNTLCDYRDITRRRKRKRSIVNLSSSATPTSHLDRAAQHDEFSPLPSNPTKPLGINTLYNAGVSATDQSSSGEVRLHYGSTSYFSLLQYIYKSLAIKSNDSELRNNIGRDGEVQELDAGLDKFSMRRIFFGFASDQPSQMPEDIASVAASPSPFASKNCCQPPLLFLSPDIARLFMTNFLKTTFRLTPMFSRRTFERNLNQLYPSCPSPSSTPPVLSNTSDYHHTLLALALGSLTTPYRHWGDILFNCAKASFAFLDDIEHAIFQLERGRSNSCFLYIGAAIRKAVAAGLHKEPPRHVSDPEALKKRYNTMWCLHFFDRWSCFCVGRPPSLPLSYMRIPMSEHPFLCAAVRIVNLHSRCADEIYLQPHQSLLEMRRVACTIYEDLLGILPAIEEAFGCGLDKNPATEERLVQQHVIALLYYYTVLMIFRPFIIFRGRLLHDGPGPPSGPLHDGFEMPSWINELCDYAITGCRRTVMRLERMYLFAEPVYEFRYHALLLTSVAFTLIYDFIFDEKSARENLPWVHAALRILTRMQTGYPCNTVMEAIQTILKGINPAYVWNPAAGPSANLQTGSSTTNSVPNVSRNVAAQGNPVPPWANDASVFQSRRSQPQEPLQQPAQVTDAILKEDSAHLQQPPPPKTSSSIPSHPQSVPVSQYLVETAPLHDIFDSANVFQNTLPISADSNLIDITLADTGWDFSAMDLETSLAWQPDNSMNML